MSQPLDPTPDEPDARAAEHGAQDQDQDWDEGWDDLPREPYTLRRFLRELAVAVAILAIGLPLVLLATGGREQEQDALTQDPVAVQPVPSATPTGSASATATASAPAPSASSAALPVEDRPVLFFAGPSMATDAGRVIEALGQGGRALTSPGAGFAAGSPSLTSLLAEGEFSPEQDAVVVQGGETDAALPDAQIDLAAQQLADRIRLKFSPSTAIVFIGPVPGALPEEQLLRVRDLLKAAAREKRVHFVDPVEQGWSLADADLADKVAAVVAPRLDAA